MRKSFQTEWQGIRFSEFIDTSSWVLAGPDFYQAYYGEFFRRYQRWEQLSREWCKQKEHWADFILARSRPSHKILSVGCGLGIVEHYMRARDPQLDLCIHEVAPSAWRWIGPEFPEQKKFIGLIPACLPKGLEFDLIYLAGVDYALSDEAMIQFLSLLRSSLRGESGECLLISGSFQVSPVTPMELTASFARGLKDCARAVLDICGLHNRGQFWGWTRTRSDYHALMRSAGYQGIRDGFIDKDQDKHYWISGR